MKNRTEKKPKKQKLVSLQTDNSVAPKSALPQKIIRFILWAMIVFIFAKGAIVSLQGNQAVQMEKVTTQFMQQQAAKQALHFEISSFATNFTKEYLTYAPQQKDGYTTRLAPYVAQNLLFDTNFNNTANVKYVQAYKVQQKLESVYDVSVIAAVEYENGSIENTYLKIPIKALEDGYSVIDFPLIIGAPGAMKYNSTEYFAQEVDSQITANITGTLENFFTALYQQKQTQIEYYLTQGADRDKFTAIAGRFTFVRNKTIRVYAAGTPNQYLVTAIIVIEDSANKQQLTQRMNLTVLNIDGRYYISDINTAITDLN